MYSYTPEEFTLTVDQLHGGYDHADATIFPSARTDINKHEIEPH